MSRVTVGHVLDLGLGRSAVFKTNRVTDGLAQLDTC